MRIDFFEEFPAQNSWKAKLINFPSTIYIAAKSLREFEALKKKLHKINYKLEAGYWPILEKSYWISPFSYNYELKKLFNELKKNKRKNIEVMLDLELPILNKKLFFINLFSFFRNKRLIKNLIKDSKKLNIEIYAAEYPALNLFTKKIFEFLGVSYSSKKYNYKKIVMMYSSVINNKFVLKKIKRFIADESKNQNTAVGLGVIAEGIFGNHKNPLNVSTSFFRMEFEWKHSLTNGFLGYQKQKTFIYKLKFVVFCFLV